MMVSFCGILFGMLFHGGALVGSGGVVFVVVEGERDVLVDSQWLFLPLAPSL